MELFNFVLDNQDLIETLAVAVGAATPVGIVFQKFRTLATVVNLVTTAIKTFEDTGKPLKECLSENFVDNEVAEKELKKILKKNQLHAYKKDEDELDTPNNS